MFKWVGPIYTQRVRGLCHGLKSLGVSGGFAPDQDIFFNSVMYVDISKQETIKQIIERWKIVKR